ncbi:nonribosomal peptide [Colletotrichum karsti]|uniref:Nonribosomal peptide n=1 Tax=Colletotrichum karsti TaxID=1095194 RepID=A0A9P6LGN0_9PEZI|nr:nonribosomal peptide [Colletotrichum karsti]KAF9871755.1 nonribosomal peptide [Colletotrichum karsti]
MNGASSGDDGQSAVQTLKVLYSKILSIPVEDVDDCSSFVALGGDSFKAVNLFQKCTEQGLVVRFQDLLHKSLADVAAFSQAAAENGDAGSSGQQRAGRDETFTQMPADYDFGKLFDELKRKQGLSPDDVEDIYPCSPMQENMYVGQKMSSKRLYRSRGLFESQSGFDVDRFKASWHEIIRRHQTLRTIYVETADPSGGRLLDAVVLKDKLGRVIVKNCDDVAEVHRLFREESLDDENDQDDQHQITIYSDSKGATHGRILFQVDLNHLTVDGSSLMVIMEELVKGLRGVPVLGPATGYGKYIEYLQDEVDEDAALDYWIDYIDGAEPCYLPTMNDNQGGDAGSFEVVEMPLDTSLEELRTFCRNFNATISNTLQAVWSLVLHTYTGEPDVCFGYLSSGRSLPIIGVSEIVGPMMNLLVCRVRGIDNKSLGDLLGDIRHDFVHSLPHQCFSIGKVQRILGNNENKLFNTIMTSYFSPAATDERGSNVFRLVTSHNASDFDIVLKVVYSDSDIRIRIAYSTATLSPAMADGVSRTFSSILRRMVSSESPDSSVGPTTTISPEGLRQVMDWNVLDAVDETTPGYVHQLIEERAQLQPDAPAIYAWDGEMTYDELEKAATCVASYITSLGIGPGAFIPLCFQKSVWYSVALLAVLKSGNAFVPLDLSNPAARVQEMLKQLGISEDRGLIICSPQQAAELSSSARNVLELDEEQLSAIASSRVALALPVITPQHPAYIIFTSGSTGTPKGVVVDHGSYAYAARAHSNGIQINATSRVLQFASYGFDTSMEDHLTTFAVGACLCVPSEEMRLGLPDLADFATKSQANWAHLTPSFAEMLTPALLPTMKTMVLGGEAMSGKNVRNWANPGKTKLIQVYGPSECCVTSTIGNEVTPEGDPTNIGKAVPGCATWVVRPEDPHVLQAVGAVGELLMEGPILARGYLNSAEQTAEAFVTALRWAPEKRLYRTGDLVKYDSSGDLHFVGRRDGQVKLRGQRLELGEIERQLVLHHQVQHCLVLVPKSGPCAKRLVAFVTIGDTSSGSKPTISTPSTEIETLGGDWSDQVAPMRDFLLDKVPPYMTPEVWIPLKSLPRSSSGKLDRKRMEGYLEHLTEDQYANLVSHMQDKGTERDGNETELLLRSIWSEVLNVPEEEIRWDTSFYHLGGDSISAMTVSSLGRQKGFNISAADVLKCRSIERLAKAASRIEHVTRKPVPTAASMAEPMEGDPFPLSPIQQLHFQASPNGDVLDQHTMVVQVANKVEQETLLSAVESILEAHPMLRARFECHDGEWMQRITTSDIHQNCRMRFHGRDQIDYVIECISESKRSLNLETGPLVGLDFFETRRQTLLSITIHHLVVDTVSWRTLFRELENFLLFGGQVEPEATTFQSWCHAQRQHAATLNIKDVLPPSDRVAPTDLGFWGMKDKNNCFKSCVAEKLTLTAELTKALSLARSTSNYASLDLMVTAVGESFYETFGRSPAVFIEGHGRESFSADMNPWETVGWFTTFLPVYAEHHEDSLATLNSVRELRANTTLSGLPYFMSRFLNTDGVEAFKERHWPMEITLNYLGAFQQFERQGSLFKRCDDALQSRLSELRKQQRADSARYSLISILAVMKDDQLSIEIEWNSQMKHQDKLKDWVSQLESSFEQIVNRMASQNLPDSPIDNLPPSVGLNSKRLMSALGLAKTRLNLQPGQIEAVYPCSPIQDSLMLSQLKRPSNVYSQHFLFKLSSEEQLQPENLYAAWKHVVAVHPILRTLFLEDDEGAFLQVVVKTVSPDIEILRLEDEQDLPSLWAKQSTSPGPSPLSGKILHKLKIYSAKDGAIYCFLDKNHIITDGTTSRLLIRNFLDAYEGRLRGDVSPYSNYIKYTSEQNLADITSYWTHYLDGAVSCQFPKLSQASFSPGQQLEFARTSSVLPDQALLENSCRRLEVTLPVMFQAAWSLVLATYLNSDDVVFGLLCHGRDAPITGAQDIIGPMASIVPMRAKLPVSMKLSEVIATLREDSIEHMSRQAISLARIQHAVKRSGDSMFNTILNFQKTGMTLPPASIQSELLYAHDTSEYDLAVCVTEDQGGLEITIESPKHFMSETQAQRLLAVYIEVVQRLIRDPDVTVGQLSLATDMDKDQLHEWNSVELETSKRCIHEMISETILRQPSKPAISSWDGDLTYVQLDLLSNKLAAQLQAIGAKPNEIIVLCFEKSLWAVVSMLAVAKSGAAFVHIDPKGAPKRTEYVIKETKARIGLASLEQYENFVSLVDTILIVNKPAVMGLPTPNLNDIMAASAEPDNTLYVIFTSGTTGQPKGVVIQHKSFCSAVVANRSWLQIRGHSRVLQFTNYCFDASMEEIFTVLVAGGCICIPSEKERMTDIPGFVERKKVNWAAFTPSFLRTLDPHDLKPVKFITVHAEPMGQDLVARWADKIHMRPSYGPTECSVTSTVGLRFTADTDATNIGFPIGCRGWVVHPENQDILMPIGAVGELLLDGPIVGKGYLNDEAKTEAAFIDPPSWALQVDSIFGSSPERKLYKTGDLVRFAEDGSLLIQRRKDHSQVKIRGQRVELGEIQHHLNQLAGNIQHSMVFMPNAGLLKGRLVAVASLTALSAGLDTGNYGVQALKTVDKEALGDDGRKRVSKILDEVTSVLEKDLPPYMVPETWLIVKSLPVQLSLKLDRQRVINWVEGLDKATLQSILDLSQHGSSHYRKGSETEEVIRKIWGEVLGMDSDRMGLDQSFFRLGGDSIYAMQVMRRCKAAGLQVTTQDVLANPTVKQLALVAVPHAPPKKRPTMGRSNTAISAPAASRAITSVSMPTTPITPLMPTPPQSPEDAIHLSPFAKYLSSKDVKVEAVVPCSPFQRRMYNSFLKKPQKPYLFNSLVWLKGIDDGAAVNLNRLFQAWQQTVDRHAILRTVFVSDPAAKKIFQKVLRKHKADIATVSAMSEEDAIRQSQTHLDAVRLSLFKNDSPPVSLRILMTLDHEVYLHIVMGHMLIDHVSLDHVFADFASFYRGQTPVPTRLSAGFDQYIEYVCQHRNIRASNQFWVDKLRDVKPYMIPSESLLTTDPYCMGSVNFTMDVNQKMKEFLRSAGITLSNLLQFTWAMVLHVYTGHETVCFGHLVSDRDIDIPHADEIVGPMLSLMIASASVKDSTILADALRNFQDESIRSLRHKTFDLTEVERQLDCEKTGLFNTLVNYRKVKYSGEGHDANYRSIWKQDPHEQLLVLSFNEDPARLEASLTYYESLFSKQTLNTLAEAYSRILQMLVGGKHRTVGDMKAVLNS